jgi:xanthine dehydrogenase YagR molybdenum-binding subunit
MGGPIRHLQSVATIIRLPSRPLAGIGEIGIVGMNAAVANAVFHATEKRVRGLPLRPETLF